MIVQAGGGGAHRHRGLGRADRGERLHEHRAHPPLGQRLQGRSGEESLLNCLLITYFSIHVTLSYASFSVTSVIY